MDHSEALKGEEGTVAHDEDGVVLEGEETF